MVFPFKCTTFCNIYVTNLVFFLPYLENIFFRLEKYFFQVGEKMDIHIGNLTIMRSGFLPFPLAPKLPAIEQILPQDIGAGAKG